MRVLIGTLLSFSHPQVYTFSHLEILVISNSSPFQTIHTLSPDERSKTEVEYGGKAPLPIPISPHTQQKNAKGIRLFQILGMFLKDSIRLAQSKASVQSASQITTPMRRTPSIQCF